MAEVLIRNAAELKAAFQPCPEAFNMMHRHMLNIADALRPMMPESTPYTVQVDPPRRRNDDSGYWFPPVMEVTVDGSRVCFDLDFREQYSGSWRPKATGKYSVVVGQYGDMKTFPPRKDLTYNYTGIAEVIHKLGIVTLNEGRDRRVKNSNDDMAKPLIKEFPWAGDMVKTSYWYIGHKSRKEIVAPLGHVFLDLGKLKLKPAEAAKVLEVLRDVLGKGA